jgi:uncharacterized protein DUF5010
MDFRRLWLAMSCSVLTLSLAACAGDTPAPLATVAATAPQVNQTPTATPLPPPTNTAAAISTSTAVIPNTPVPISSSTATLPPSPSATTLTSGGIANAATPTRPPRPTPGPTGTPLPTFAAPAGFPTETPAPDYLSWARPGPYRSPYLSQFNLESFSSAQPLVTTYFFYWYDWAGRAGGLPERATGPGPITVLPSYANSITFLDTAWYEKEFTDMLDAGVDFVLPDYWGEPGQINRRVAPAPAYNYFSTQGIPPMIEALDRMRAQGKKFKIGLFLDTTVLNDEDLTTERGKQIFYTSIRDFYARIPPIHWAAIDNRPVVWLYDAQRVGNFNQSSFDYVYEHFAQDFGGLKPYIVREWQWYTERGATNNVIKTEGLYGWGAAPFGFNVDTRFTIAEVGPGFGQLQFGGRDPIYTDRQNGKYYEDNLKAALRSRRKILGIETWNEYDEATGIAETIEYGRKYIELTRKYADLFKAGKIP